jgi:hypothetical protein
MSTNPPPIPETPESMNDDQLKQAIQNQNQPTSQPAAATEPIEIKAATGQVYRGSTPQEVIDQLLKAQENATAVITEEREQNRQLQGRLQEIEKRVQSQPPAPKSSKFDKIKYFQTWEQDPLEAERQAVREILADEFGVETFEELRDTLRFTNSEALNTAQQRELILFQAAHPEIPYNPETAELVVNRMRENGVDDRNIIRKQDMEYAALQLITEGKIKTINGEPEPVRQAPPVPPPPQGVGSSSMGNGAVTEDKAYSMPMNEFEALLRQTGILKH